MNMKIFAVLALLLVIGAVYASNAGGQGTGNGNGNGKGNENGKKYREYESDNGSGDYGNITGNYSCDSHCKLLNGSCLCNTPVPAILRPVRITIQNPSNKTVTRACPWFCDRSNGGCECSVKVPLNINFNFTNNTLSKPKYKFCNYSCYNWNSTCPCQLQNCTWSNFTTCSCGNATNCTIAGTLPCVNLTDQNLTNCTCTTTLNQTCTVYNSTCPCGSNRTCTYTCTHPGLGNTISKILPHRNETENESDDEDENETENETNRHEKEIEQEANGIAGVLERTRERVRERIEAAIEKNNEKIANALRKLASRISNYDGNRFGLVKTDGDATISGQVETESGTAYINVVTYKRLPTWAVRERLRSRVSAQEIYDEFESEGADTANGAMNSEGEHYEVGG